MTNLKEKILETEVRLIGNRVSTLGITLTGGSLVGLNLTPAGSLPLALGITYAGLCITGSYLAGYSIYGLGTLKNYKRASEHIKQFGKLDERFFKTLIGFDKNKKFTGYCQIQGMYLACRDNKPELLPEFYRLKKEHTKNIIPNF